MGKSPIFVQEKPEYLKNAGQWNFSTEIFAVTDWREFIGSDRFNNFRPLLVI